MPKPRNKKQVWKFLNKNRNVAIINDLVLARSAVIALRNQQVAKFGRTFATSLSFLADFLRW